MTEPLFTQETLRKIQAEQAQQWAEFWQKIEEGKR